MILDNDAPSRCPKETIRPLALLPMKGTDSLGARVNEYLTRWNTTPESDMLFTHPVNDKKRELFA